ncbi:MAG: sulfite exporter TauE/SafE family protein [Planctomycetes bacterium]|nr:sulfite exporter TauE/SafE family protein [Planctomycetota bacterium]
MWSVLTGVLVASVLGSLHCAGMCGGIVVVVAADSRAANLAYNFGRLVSYVIVGALAGYFGVMLDLGGESAGVAHLAIVVAGVVMIGYGVVQLLRIKGVRVSLPALGFLSKIYSASFAKVQSRGPLLRALMVGLLTALLPCGWLYLFAINAATSQDPLMGALIMLFFWLGTVPVLATMGVLVKLLGDKVKRRLPIVSALLLITIGAYTLFGRWHMPSFAEGIDNDPTAPACCDEV